MMKTPKGDRLDSIHKAMYTWKYMVKYNITRTASEFKMKGIYKNINFEERR